MWEAAELRPLALLPLGRRCPRAQGKAAGTVTSPQPELHSPAEQVCPGSEKPGRQAPPAQAFSALTAITPRQAGRRPGSEVLLHGLDLGGLPDGGRRASRQEVSCARSPQTAGEARRGETKAVTVQDAHGAVPLPGRSDPHLTSMNSTPCSWASGVLGPPGHQH